MSKLNNRKWLKAYRKSLRNNLTPAEARLWRFLKSKGVGYLKFRRQHSIGNYIVDFYCPSLKLIIELDGDIHSEPRVSAADREKESYFQSEGFIILRYPNEDVLYALSKIKADIIEITKNLKQISPPSQGGVSASQRTGWLNTQNIN